MKKTNPTKIRLTGLLLLLIVISIKTSAQNTGSRYYVLTDEQSNTFIQQRKDTQRLSEFHAHTSMKNYNNNVPTQAYLDANINSMSFKQINWSGSNAKMDAKFNNFKSYRQADFGMVAESHASILVSAISPIEKHLLSKKKPIWYLPLSFRFINGKVSGLPASRLRTIYNKNNSSNKEFNNELRFLLSQQEQDPRNAQVKISLAKNKDDLIRKFTAGETALVLSLEGGHIFHGDAISKNRSYDSPTFLDYEQKEILDNVDSLKNLPNRVFFVTLGHFIWNGLVGSPKSLDMDNNKRKWLRIFSRRKAFRRKLFLKYSDGIVGPLYINKTNDKVPFEDRNYCICQREIDTLRSTGDIGWKVIERLLDTSGRHHAPVYIDVKHMDILARLQYYRLLKDKHHGIPIIASHVAVTGKDTATAKHTSLCPVYDVYEEVENTKNFYYSQFKKPGPQRESCLDSTKIDMDAINWFYPWGINLANEEIAMIYESDGIIGLAMEERIIGTNRPNYTPAYFKSVESFLSREGVPKDSFQIFHSMIPFFKNMFFVAEHSGRNDATTWDHISLGSDFDGIAKPAAFCRSLAEIPIMYRRMMWFLPLFIKMENKQTYGLTAAQITKKIMFENGERFILKYF